VSERLTELCRRLVLGELAAVSRQDPHGLAGHFADDCEFVDLSDGTRIQGKPAFLADLLARERMYYDAAALERQLAEPRS
jgi:hypothetical protein